MLSIFVILGYHHRDIWYGILVPHIFLAHGTINLIFELIFEILVQNSWHASISNFPPFYLISAFFGSQNSVHRSPYSSVQRVLIHRYRSSSHFVQNTKMVITVLILHIQTCFWCQNVRNNKTQLLNKNLMATLMKILLQSPKRYNNMPKNGFGFTHDVVLYCQ